MRDIKGYEGQYSINEEGQVWSHKRHKFLKANILKGMYLRIGLRDSTKGQKRNLFLVHRLVAEAFIKNPKKKKEVNHKNSNGFDNRVSNLEWVTRSENNQHAWDYGKKVFVKTDKFLKSVRANVEYARCFIGRK